MSVTSAVEDTLLRLIALWLRSLNSVPELNTQLYCTKLGTLHTVLLRVRLQQGLSDAFFQHRFVYASHLV